MTVTTSPARMPPPATPVPALARVEGAAVAVAAAVLVVRAGYPWWWLLAVFLVFDLSMLGYAVGHRTGAIGYNLVHNLAVPLALLGVHVLLGQDGGLLLAVAGCWLFHVGTDRALGFGPRPLR
ncbi:MAG: DUF4260 domain-containing protein [Cellulomonas sp.]|nr:DUF4260 domain-containing protein [Cellulomonas sp.]